ncbi:GvpL/GvpF family gas vesicle protein [Streptosporangium fragile]|uniref:GvpL/GvpF family gas vesicle protein n=1 Tax=Streptosporangium fragile TaxID=46186 RepID=A0ABN3W1E2_9ACTN
MSGPSGRSRTAEPERARAAGSRGSGCYIYGIVPADVELTSDTRGVGDPPGRVELVRHGEIAALVSDVPVDRPLGRPDDLMAHERLLDEAAGEVPVLPLRFGAVVTDTRAVVDELLAPYHDDFLAALNELEGRAQYVVKGRYVEQAVLRETLEEEPEIAQLREEIRGRSEEETWDARIRIGELISEVIAAKREADTEALTEALAPLCAAVAVREPTHEYDALHLALLVETRREGEIEQVLEAFDKHWTGRVELRLLGPMAPYDFVAAREQQGGDEP